MVCVAGCRGERCGGQVGFFGNGPCTDRGGPSKSAPKWTSCTTRLSASDQNDLRSTRLSGVEATTSKKFLVDTLPCCRCNTEEVSKASNAAAVFGCSIQSCRDHLGSSGPKSSGKYLWVRGDVAAIESSYMQPLHEKEESGCTLDMMKGECRCLTARTLSLHQIRRLQPPRPQQLLAKEQPFLEHVHYANGAFQCLLFHKTALLSEL